MEFACHVWSFHDLTLPEALGTIARLGFRYADLAPAPAKAALNPRQYAAEVNNDLLMYNLRVSDLYLMLPRISMAEWRDKDIETFKALLPMAEDLRTSGITVSPGVVQTDAGAFERTAESLRLMLSAAQAAKLRLSIEPHPDSMAQTPAAALLLLDAVPGLELTLDWANLVYGRAKHEDILRLLPRVRHVHFRQAAPGKLQTPFEKGVIEFSRVVRDLIDAGCTAVVSVELVNTVGRHGIAAVNPIRECAQIRDALRDARDKKVRG